MNSYEGVINNISVNQNLSLIDVKINQLVLTTIIIDTPENNPAIKIGHSVQLLFKETEVVVATGEVENISLRNKIPGKVLKIIKGKLLSKIFIQTSIGEVVSIITSKAVLQLELKEGTKVIAMVKTNEMMISS